MRIIKKTRSHAQNVSYMMVNLVVEMDRVRRNLFRESALLCYE